MERVLVVFQATGRTTESQALAFGLGAVEGGANIRLRHLPGITPAALEHQGYGHIKNEDIAWAEVIGLAIEAPEPADELTALIDQIKTHLKTTNLPSKKTYVFGHTVKTAAIGFVQDALQSAGFSLVNEELSDDLQYLKSVGHKLAVSQTT